MKLIAERRLASGLLAGGPELGTPADVVRWFGAVQAAAAHRPAGAREERASGAARALPPGTLVPNGVLLLDGQVAGHWKRTSTKDTLLVEALLYRAFTPAEAEALDAAAARQAAFLGLRPRVATRVLDGAS